MIDIKLSQLENIRQDQVEFLLRLKAKLKGDNKGAIHLCEDKAFGKSVSNFITIDNMLFADGLEGVNT